MAAGKMWDGRFATATDALLERFNASIDVDRRLLAVDVAGSQAWARALARVGVLTGEEAERLVAGLDQVRDEMSAADYPWSAALEDIHMAVEQRLTERIGPLGGKLHTGRSRNDQVCLDERLYLRVAVADVEQQMRALQRALVATAAAHPQVILPGYTHLQRAQPILFAHYALSLFWMLERDRGRMADLGRRADVLPLGAGALAGSAFAVDRRALADDLGFAAVSANSLDAVSDRDFLIEFVAAAAIAMMHLSRYCEDLIVWSSAEFGFVELGDAFATGSSMMPQKKNPDSLELVRGKTGRVYGDLVSLLAMMKGLPLTYAKDMQEDKEPFFDAVDTVGECLRVFTGAWGSMALRPERMAAALDDGMLATDLADHLVRQGLPFREAHRVVGRLVRVALERGVGLAQLDLETLQAESPRFAPQVRSELTHRGSLQRRELTGGTGPAAVAAQLEAARAALAG